MSIFHIHQWLRWSDLVEGHANVKMQFRTCDTCGKTQKRSIGTCDYANASAANNAINETKREMGYVVPQTNA